MTKRLNVTPIPWPFWGLALAWLCANLPSATPFELVASLRHFQHFSHQAALSHQALALLQATPRASTEAVTKSAEAQAPKPPPAATETVKKLDLGTAPREPERSRTISEPLVYLTSSDAPPDWSRAEPPLRPPKRSWVS